VQVYTPLLQNMLNAACISAEGPELYQALNAASVAASGLEPSNVQTYSPVAQKAVNAATVSDEGPEPEPPALELPEPVLCEVYQARNAASVAASGPGLSYVQVYTPLLQNVVNAASLSEEGPEPELPGPEPPALELPEPVLCEVYQARNAASVAASGLEQSNVQAYSPVAQKAVNAACISGERPEPEPPALELLEPVLCEAYQAKNAASVAASGLEPSNVQAYSPVAQKAVNANSISEGWLLEFVAEPVLEFVVGTVLEFVAGTVLEFVAGTVLEFVAGTVLEFVAGTATAIVQSATQHSNRKPL